MEFKPSPDLLNNEFTNIETEKLESEKMQIPVFYWQDGHVYLLVEPTSSPTRENTSN